MSSDYLRIAEILFKRLAEPMSARQLIDEAKRQGLLSDKLVGLTPHQTMKSKLSVDIRRHGDASRFTRVRPGQFFLRSLLDDEHREYKAAALRPPPTGEHVLAFPSERLDAMGRFQGVTVHWRRKLSRILSGDLVTLDRLEAEQDDRYKQIVTYLMVTRGAELLSFRRGIFNRVEDYLRGAQCIGFGGHLSSADINLFSFSDAGVHESAIRELREELALPAADLARLYEGGSLRVVGLLNDDSSPVGVRHFGIVMQYDVSDDSAWDEPQRGEKSITQLRWLDTRQANFQIRDFEYWSQLCLRTYYPRAIRTQASYAVRRRRPFTPPHLLCVLGPIGSGKTQATATLREDYGYAEVNSGRVLAEILGFAPVPITDRAAFHEAAWRFITTPTGPRRLAHAILQAATAADNPRVLIDGIRQRKTLEELERQAMSDRVAKLFIHTPPDLAYELYTGREESTLNQMDFLRLRATPVESEAESFIDVADAVLYNWMGFRSYARAIRALMSDLGIERPVISR